MILCSKCMFAKYNTNTNKLYKQNLIAMKSKKYLKSM